MARSPIPVTRTFLPPLENYEIILRDIFATSQLTNGGPLLKKLEQRLKSRLEVPHLQLVANGTLALQMSLKALELEGGEIITTPFSYVATVGSILWERCTPVFVDIEPCHFTLNPSGLEDAITARTRAIMPVHVFGYACDVDGIAEIAAAHDLAVIYDAAHAFGSRYQGRSLLAYGDISVCSLHATKLFHTGEGGLCLAASESLDKRLDLIKRFGHSGDKHICLGFNAKMSELHAALGLAVLPFLDENIASRRVLSEHYDQLLSGLVTRPASQPGLEYNYAYYPILLRDETQREKVLTVLAGRDILARRYFWPSLNTLPYLPRPRQSCPVSEDIAARVLCLPLFSGLTPEDQALIADTVTDSL